MEKEREQQKKLQDAFETVNEANMRNEAFFSMTNATQWSYEIDASGKVVSARYGERIRTHTNADLADPMGWTNIIHPEDRERVIAEFMASVRDRSGKTPYGTTYRIMMKDGSFHWAKANGRLISHADGTAELFGMSINITEQIEQEREQQKQLAEDNGMNREIATEILEENGFTVDTAEDGDIAVSKMKDAKAGELCVFLLYPEQPVGWLRNHYLLQEQKAGQEKDGSGMIFRAIVI